MNSWILERPEMIETYYWKLLHNTSVDCYYNLNHIGEFLSSHKMMQYHTNDYTA